MIKWTKLFPVKNWSFDDFNVPLEGNDWEKLTTSDMDIIKGNIKTFPNIEDLIDDLNDENKCT